MSTRSALAELRKKKRCIERAIRALECLQRVEEGDTVEAKRPEVKPAHNSRLIVVHRRPPHS